MSTEVELYGPSPHPVELPHQRRVPTRELRSAPVVSTSSSLVNFGFTRPGSGNVRTWEADDAIRVAYYQNIYVWACAKAIAEDIASLNFKTGPDPEERETYRDGPLSQLLGPPTKRSPGGPAPKISSKTWWEWTVVQLLVTGRFCHEAVGFGTAQPSLWPIPATNIRPIDSTQPGEWFSAFRYGGWGTYTRTLTPDQVFYHWRPSADDFRRPESVLQAARLDVSVAIMQDKYDHAFLLNDARPASVVVHEQFAQSQDKDAFESKFVNDFQGPENAGKPIFIETTPDGAQVKDAIAITTLGLSQKDAEFIARHDQKIRSIVVAFGVPMSRLGDSSDRTFSNAGQEYFNYYRKLKTICRELEDVVNTDVAPRVGPDFGWFDTTELDEALEDAKIQAAGLTDLIRTRVIKINEGRETLGLEAVPDGDRFLTDEELGLLQGAAAQIVVQSASPPPAATPPAPSAEAPSATADAQPTDATRFTSAPPEVRDEPAAETPPDRAELRLRLYTKRSRRVGYHEGRMQDAMQEILDRQLAASLSRLTGKRGRQALRMGELREPAATAPVDEVFDQTFWVKDTAERMRPIFEAIFGDAAATILEELDAGDTEFDLGDPLAYQFIEKRTNQLAGNVTNTTYRAIQSALQDGVAEGESIPKLADRIRTLFEQTYRHRAETVARTEVLSAYNGSTLATGTALPTDVVAGFEWLATPGSRTRAAHAAADGQVIPTGARFSVGGSEMQYPGDPSAPAGLVVNCRCTLLVLTHDEYQARVAEQPAQSTVQRGAHRFHSVEYAQDVLLSRAAHHPAPEDGWTPGRRESYAARKAAEVA